MEALWEALISYPPSIGALLLAMAAPLVLLVGVAGTVMKKDAPKGFAQATTIGPAILTLISLSIVTLGVATGIAESIEAWGHADPSQRSSLLAAGISTSMWSGALGASLLAILVPPVAFGCATVWGLRNAHEKKPALPLFLIAIGASLPSFVLGGLIAGRVRGFIQMFHAVAFVAADERVAVVRAGVAENESTLASPAGIAIFFGLGFALAILGAILAARKQASAPTWAIVVAAFVAFAGVTTAVNVQARGAQTDDMASYPIDEADDSSAANESDAPPG